MISWEIFQAKEILKIHVRNKHKELWGVPIRRQMMSVMLDKCEARVENKSAQEADEPQKVTPGKEKTRHDSRKEGEMLIKNDALRSEPKLVEEDLEVLPTTPEGNLSQIETLANEAENSSDGEKCTKNRTLKISALGGNPISTHDDFSKKRKRVEHGKETEDNKSKMDKKIKSEMVEKKNIKDEAVQRLKILQKGVKTR